MIIYDRRCNLNRMQKAAAPFSDKDAFFYHMTSHLRMYSHVIKPCIKNDKPLVD